MIPKNQFFAGLLVGLNAAAAIVRRSSGERAANDIRDYAEWVAHRAASLEHEHATHDR